MSKHTREPWRFTLYDELTFTIGCIESDKGLCKIISSISSSRDKNETSESNANRIVECVNAMEGIENPEQFISNRYSLQKKNKLIIDLLNKDLNTLTSICEQLIEDQGLVGSTSESFAPLREFLERNKQ